MKQIYFDHGSTSFPKAPGVAEAMAGMIERGAFNINRGNYEGAYEVAGTVLETREQLARLFHAESSKQVVFTPGITYSLNFFMKGFLQPGDHVLVSGMEHNAVMRPLDQLEHAGIEYSVIRTNADGSIVVEDINGQIRANTSAVIVLHASNVCGTIMPIDVIGRVCTEHGLIFAVDTAQSAGSIDVDMVKCNIDFLAFTAHKGLLGPQGVGGFLISERLDKRMKPLIAGGTGSQSDLLVMPDYLPDKYESGTLNLPGIIGLNAALTHLEEVGISSVFDKKMRLVSRLLEGVSEFPRIKIIGKSDLTDRVAVVSLDFIGYDNSDIAFRLEQQYAIMTRVGLHCAPMAHKSLNTYPQGTVRFSFGGQNTEAEVDILLDAFRELFSI